ncbi:MAG: hexameric tyrosine-coordinated heme protein [Marinobacter sp.]|uniref:hexameric tyrosine-coordinated heme protein n=1 Tax=Marinobacter sp. TaxID=50741 RepID=UPI003F957F0B
MRFIKAKLLVLAVIMFLAAPLSAETEMEKTSSWLPSLQTSTPQEGFELAVKLSRVGVKTTQPDKEVLFREREKYAQSGEALIHASEVIAVHFQTVAAANNYWK